jgi:signal transduction histidine kinase
MQADRVHTGCWFQEPGGGLEVGDGSEQWQEDVGRRSRRRHRHKRRRSRQEIQEQLLQEEAGLTPEERAYRRAHRLAEEKTRLTTELIWVTVIGLPLLLFLFPVGVIVILCFGWGPGRRAYRLVVEPRLRERFIQQEVEKQVHATLSRERQALEGEHARSMQQLSASIAHEIRNPITAAKSLVQQMEEDPTSRENVEYARVALEELQRVERSVSHLLRFARDEEMHLAPLRMAEVLDSALETFRDRLERRGVTLDLRVDAEGELRGDAEKLRRVVINLIGNAVEVLEEAGSPEPRVEVSLGENLAGTEVWLRVRDNGPGIEPETLQRLFSPFYTSKTGGTGLGLAISRKLVDAHGGSIEVRSEPGQGAEFLVTLPKRSGDAEPAP